jgi:hypothetical protein
VSRYRWHVCVTASGLDELTQAQQASDMEVLRVLESAGRFSVFEATDNPVIAATMDRIMGGAYFDHIDNPCPFCPQYGERCNHPVDQPPVYLRRTAEPGAYPWVNVELTDAGRELLAQAGAQ